MIEVNKQYYILAESPRIDDSSRVLRHGDTFAVFDHVGNIQPLGLGEEGLFHQGTRFLSRLTLLVNGRPPLLLSSSVRQDNALLTVDLTNPDISEEDQVTLPRDSVHLLRSIHVWNGVCYLRTKMRNYSTQAVSLTITLAFHADFADIFEVRGTRRARRGDFEIPRVGEGDLALTYQGLDRVLRATKVRFSPTPTELTAEQATYEIVLEPRAETLLDMTVACQIGKEAPPVEEFPISISHITSQLKASRASDAQIETSNALFNDWMNRSAADLHMMLTHTKHGAYPYAGVPWFNTPFGRDGIITAFEYLWINPDIARGVLTFLAHHQASELSDARDAEPGKILHEMRSGEMASLNEVPFGRYYGSIDATPLFVMLAGEYYCRTADRRFVDEIWPAVERALHWIDNFGDRDYDGFFEYARRSPTGLVTQGWKDSFDSVFHASGRLAEAPIALCEVQGYVYAAWSAAADLAEIRGDDPLAESLRRRARDLQLRFDAAYWLDDLSTYAIALDRDKNACRVKSSNAGHCLFTGIAQDRRAERLAKTLLDSSSFTGWGIRTVADTEPRYNPMSYHNGSVWPHDNALIAWGLSHYGFQQDALRILAGLFEASLHFDLRRMPELFCGFGKRAGDGPTLYPVACSPQSWSAGAVFLVLQACLGLKIDAPRRRLCFHSPALPESLSEVKVQNLRIGDAVVDVAVHRHPHDVAVSILNRVGDIELMIVK